MFHRETDAQKVARNRDAIFDLHARALAWLEEYTGIPYPWGKFDFVGSLLQRPAEWSTPAPSSVTPALRCLTNPPRRVHERHASAIS